MPLPFLQTHPEGVVLSVRVSPRASRSKCIGLVGDELKVLLNAPPVDGQSNQELVKIISKMCGIAKSQAAIISGQRSRSKKLLITGLSVDQAEAVFRSFDTDK